MDWLKTRIWAWLNYGTQGYEPHQARRLVVINVMITLAPLISLPYLLLMLFWDPAGLWVPTLIIFLISLGFPITPLFHQVNPYLGGIYNLTVWVIFGLSTVYLLGQPAGIQYFFLMGAVSAMAILGVKLNILSLISITFGISAFLLTETGRMPHTNLVSLPPELETLFFYTSVLLSFAGIFCVVFYAFSQAHRAEALLEKEYDYSERLLSALMPASIASQLKREPEVTIADSYENVSIMFADIVGFTPMAAENSATQTVELLSRIFTEFDQLAAKHGVEKIKTLGDAYMVAAGLPETQSDHAQRLAAMAEDMIAFMDKISQVSDRPIQLRIGIHSGSAMAGVIGRQKPFYDVWGDTVNVAARMESYGLAGKIQVSETTKALIEDTYELIKQDPVVMKGVGLMTPWIISARKNTGNS